MSSRICILASALLATTFVHADLISIDNEYGAGAGTVDTAQGLEFLDITLTTNIPVIDMERMIGINGDMREWRYASIAEVATLLNNAGADIPTVTGRYYIPSEPAEQVIELVGTTRVIPGFGYGVNGVTGDFLPRNGNYLFKIDALVEISDFADVSSLSIVDSTERSEQIGHWIVRDNSLPAPSSFALLSIAALTSQYRRR